MSDADLRRLGFKPQAREKPSPLKGLQSTLVVGAMLCLSAAPQVSRAQAEPPPVLDPADIFTDAVEVVETLPILNADNAARMLWYFDPAAGEWRGYAYPEEFGEMQFPYPNISPRPDGTFFISEEGIFRFSTPSVENAWIFNPTNGELTHPESACNRFEDFEGNGRWVIYQNPEAETYHLCFTETGELSRPLPNELQPNLCDEWRRPPAISPDGKWVVFADCKFHPYSLYAYEIETGQVNYLGSGEEADNIEVIQWVDNIHAVIHSDESRNYSFRSVYVADVTQPESLELIASQYMIWPRYYDDPPRYEWVPGEFITGAPGIPSDWCQIHVYYLETMAREVYPEAPRICGVGTIIPNGNGDRLYRAMDWPETGNPATATIIRFNPVTGEEYEIISSEIEWIDSVSPGGSYVVLWTDNNGIVYPDSLVLDPQFEEGTQIGSPYLTVLDLTTLEIVYDVEMTKPDLYSLSPTLDWIDDGSFLLNYRELDREWYRLTSSHIVTIESGRVIESTLETPGTLLTDRQRLLLRDHDTLATSIFYIGTNETIPIIKPINHNQYTLNLDFQADHRILVTITDSQHPDYLDLGRWLIRIP